MDNPSLGDAIRATLANVRILCDEMDEILRVGTETKGRAAALANLQAIEARLGTIVWHAASSAGLEPKESPQPAPPPVRWEFDEGYETRRQERIAALQAMPDLREQSGADREAAALHRSRAAKSSWARRRANAKGRKGNSRGHLEDYRQD